MNLELWIERRSESAEQRMVRILRSRLRRKRLDKYFNLIIGAAFIAGAILGAL